MIWRWQNLHEIGAPCEVKGGAADAKIGSMTSDELWTLDSTSSTSSKLQSSCSLFRTLTTFQNAKALLIWSVYANLVII